MRVHHTPACEPDILGPIWRCILETWGPCPALATVEKRTAYVLHTSCIRPEYVLATARRANHGRSLEISSDWPQNGAKRWPEDNNKSWWQAGLGDHAFASGAGRGGQLRAKMVPVKKGNTERGSAPMAWLGRKASAVDEYGAKWAIWRRLGEKLLLPPDYCTECC